MSNPLVQSMGGTPPGKLGDLVQLKNIVGMLRSGNPQKIAQGLMQQNPQFKAFVEANRGKSPQQVAQEHGIDLGAIMKQL